MKGACYEGGVLKGMSFGVLTRLGPQLRKIYKKCICIC